MPILAVVKWVRFVILGGPHYFVILPLPRRSEWNLTGQEPAAAGAPHNYSFGHTHPI
jgi:hypothetical protein